MTRIEKIRSKLKEVGADAVLITSPMNRRYATTFNSSAGVVLITMEKAYYIVDFRYIEAATKNADKGFTVLQMQDGFVKDIAKMAKELGIKKLAFENHAMSVADYETYTKAVDAEFVNFNRCMERVRQNKEPGELDMMKKAQSITEAAFHAVLPQIKIGITEKDVATMLMNEMYKNGADGLAFSVIAVSGTNSSLPHGVPSDKKLEDGDFLTMDFGASYKGYASDMTRTIAIGHATDEMKKVYNIVLESQLKALSVAKVGMKGVDVDAAARDIITAAGFGENFQHGLGHCVGLDVHEDPRANQVDQSQFEVGHVLTIEPGIYLPGRFGVRIEDMIYFGENGVENLTHIPKELIIVK